MIAQRFCTQSAAAGFGAARCGNFQLQLPTSSASCGSRKSKPEVKTGSQNRKSKPEVKTGSHIYSIAIAVERACTPLRCR
ncbi:hypothetical protein [Nostoc sp.]|uniref:hypothetical protein n=1 Tax=Nostoc sp. TaxID=1180 RepID=UPI002FFA35EB